MRDRTGGHLPLKQAVDEGRLEEFIAQAEAHGLESVTKDEFESAVAAIVRPPRSEDQT